jgi:myo-inositol-1(or 4)-monophosphatase
MNSSQLEQLCQQVRTIVMETATFISEELGKVGTEAIETKSLNSLVSYVDKTAEQQLVAKLEPLLPDATFLTEEGTVASREGERQWIIDPLDGTTNFLHQLPCFAVSVGLRQGDRMVLGVVCEVSRLECFYAWNGGGAYLNGHPIRVSGTARLADALIATGFPYRDYERMKPYFAAMEYFMQNSRGLRRLGASAVDLAYLACGRFDSFFEYGLSPWDVAAGIVLVTEAGGKISDFKGGDGFLFGEEMLAATPGVFEETLKVVSQAFYA